MPYQIDIAAQSELPRQQPRLQSDKSNKTNRCLSALSPHAFSLLKPFLTEVVLREGTILWDSNKASSDVYFPVSGLVSIVLDASDGVSVEVGSICSQAAVGALFEPDQRDFHTQGVVQLGGHFLRMPGPQLMLATKENREIQNLATYCRDWILMQAQQTAACNAAHTADKRFCRWLFQTCERMDSDSIHLTQEIIASLLAIRRTTVTLIAQKLQIDGLIQYRRGKITVLDRVRLRAAACECCNSLARQHWPSTRLLALRAPESASIILRPAQLLE
jgi:CRP-like cAMP-binding protein